MRRSRIVHCPPPIICSTMFQTVVPLQLSFNFRVLQVLIPRFPCPPPHQSLSDQVHRSGRALKLPYHAPNSPRRMIQLWPQPCNYLPPAMCSGVTAARSDTPMVSLSPSVVLLLPFFSLCAFHLTAFATSSFICTPILIFCRPFCRHPSPPTIYLSSSSSISSLSSSYLSISL